MTDMAPVTLATLLAAPEGHEVHDLALPCDLVVLPNEHVAALWRLGRVGERPLDTLERLLVTALEAQRD